MARIKRLSKTATQRLVIKIRTDRNMTQAELAAALDVSVMTVKRWEAGTGGEPQLRQQRKLQIEASRTVPAAAPSVAPAEAPKA